jgi:hypothetical protein
MHTCMYKARTNRLESEKILSRMYMEGGGEGERGWIR